MANISNRGFYPMCGAPLIFCCAGIPGIKRVKPGVDLFTASAQPRDTMDPDLPKFSGMPEMQP